MSRFENNLLELEQGISLELKPGAVHLKGPKGELAFALPKGIRITEEENGIKVSREDEGSKEKTNKVGLTYRMVQNMAIGVSKGFTKSLELNGVGYRWSVDGKELVMHVGFSHPVKYAIPSNIELKVEQNTLHVSGTDKQQVGQACANIRSVRPVEPYKGKGIRYVGEQITLKQGKSGT